MSTLLATLSLAEMVILGSGFLAVLILIVGGWYLWRRPDLRERLPKLNTTYTAGLGFALLAGILSYSWLIENPSNQTVVLVEQKLPGEVIANMLTTAAVFIVAYAASRAIQRSVDKMARRQSMLTQHSQQTFVRFTQVGVFIVAIIFVLSVWGIDIGDLLLGAGLLGVVVGLSARQALSSGLAGFVLMLSQPFRLGDYVQVGEQRGVVTRINIVNTYLRSQAGENIVIPNDAITGGEVINYSRNGRLELNVDVDVDYETDLEPTLDLVEEAAEEEASVLSAPVPTAYAHSFGNSSVVIRVYFWIDAPSEQKRRQARAAVVQAIKQTFDEHDIVIPFPQRTLSNRRETLPLPSRAAETAPKE
jgi:small-conductance mechanosensitive channel